jgi:hypothetical protein
VGSAAVLPSCEAEEVPPTMNSGSKIKVRVGTFSSGELRDRRRAAVPLVAAAGGMLLPVALYLTFNCPEAAT